MLKGTELTAQLMKIDIHPVVKDVLIQQQQDIFFLRKEQLEAAKVIEMLSSIVEGLSIASAGVINDLKKEAKKHKSAMEHDLNNAE